MMWIAMPNYEVNAEQTNYYTIKVEAKDTEEAFEKACATPVDKWVERQSPDLFVYNDDDDIKEIE